MSTVQSEDLAADLFHLDEADPDARRELSRIAHAHVYPRGNILFYDGEPADAVYIVMEGRVKVSLISEEGREVVLAVMRPGDAFGLLGALDPRACHVGTASTITDARLAKIPRDPFLAWFDRHPAIHRPILGDFAAMLSHAYQKIGQQALMPVKERLRAALIELARADGRPGPSDLVEFERPTHQELADLIGTTRVVVSRLLKELVEDEPSIAATGRVIRVSLRKVIGPGAPV